jgi:cytochrome c peroxidase
MRGKRFYCVLFAVLLAFAPTAYAADDMMKRARTVFKPIPSTPPRLEGNPLSPEKIELGKMLYFDPRLSSSALISCNTCHNVGMGGDDYQETSTGHGWQKGPRNAPTVLNSVFNLAQFWDGRAPDLKEQAKGPVQASVEMNNTPEMAVKTLKSMPGYIEAFNEAFPHEKDSVTFENMASAIEAFEATLLTPNCRFDVYLRGKRSALTATEKIGLRLFMDEGCSVCHGGINMGGGGYFAFGVVKQLGEGIMAGDVGRSKVTGIKYDEHVFKSPTLRNIVLTPPYFHSGKVWSLREAVEIMGSAQLGASFSRTDIDNIMAFLETTTGDQPVVYYPILPASTDSTPKPKLD